MIDNTSGCSSVMRARSKKIVWISSMVFDFCNVISQTQILNQLSKRGYDAFLFATRSRKNHQLTNIGFHLILIPLRYVPVASSSLYIFTLFILLPFFVVSTKPDYVVLEPGSSILGLMLKPFSRVLKFKMILDVRSTPIKVRNTLRMNLHLLVFRSSVTLAKKKLDGITVLTKSMKKHMCFEFDIPLENVGVWTSGVALDLFNPENYDGKEMRRKFGLEDKFIIFYHGALGTARLEGIAETIKSLEILKSQSDNLVLFLLGEGDALPTLRELVRESHLENAVVIKGMVDYSDVPKYIAMCDVGIVPLPNSPNWRYQCPLKLLEYLAMGKFVIATDIPANREVMGESKCGIYVSSVSPQAIAAAITHAYDNRKTLKKYRLIRRNIVEEKYSWMKVAEDLETYLSKI